MTSSDIPEISAYSVVVSTHRMSHLAVIIFNTMRLPDV
jgi:hypothetical protein